MKLPKIEHPIFELTLPSNNKTIKFRPFLVKEEKILLTALQGEDSAEIINAIKQVIHNCIITEDVDVDELATIDLEYLFIKIRAKSVNNIIKLTYKDLEDSKTYDVEVNLDDVSIKTDKKHKNNISINDNLGIKLKYPKASITFDINNVDNEADLFFSIFRNCIDYIYDKDNHYLASDYTREQLDEFLQDLDVKTFKKVQEFFTTMPKLHYEVKYQNSFGKEKVITLSTLNDFFTLG